MICFPTRLALQVLSPPVTHKTTMLSDKAKGKQRAVKDRSQADSGALTEGFSDLVLFISSTDTVRDVKAFERCVACCTRNRVSCPL